MASIERRGGSWRVVWRFEGRKQYTTWPKREYAEQAAELAQAHRHRITADEVYATILGEDLDPQSSAPTLREWCERWLAAKTRITPGTRATYESQLRRRIYPALGDRPIDRITPTDIGRLLNDLRDGTITRGTTVTRYYSLLHGALEAAVRERIIDRNPAALTDFVRDQVEHDDTGADQQVRLTPQEYRILRDAFPPDDQPLIDFLAGTGARWSEATALAVEHVLLDARRVRIWRAWKRDGRGGWYLGTTKGRARREIAITDQLADTLAKLVDGRPRDALVFTAPRGGQIHYANFFHRRWLPALRAAMSCPTHPPDRDEPGSTCDCPGVLRRRPTPHDLRHTHAAWLFSDPRVTPLAISRRLGHAQLATTSEIYGDLLPEAEGATIAALDDALGG